MTDFEVGPEEPEELSPGANSMARSMAAMGTQDIVARGGDPLRETPRFGGPVPMDVELERQMMLHGQREKKLNAAIFQNPESGFGDLKKFMGGVFDKYRTQNQSALIKKPTNEQEAMEQQQQLLPVTVDPNEVADIRQKLAKMQQLGRSVDPNFDVFKDPRTKNEAAWLNREAGGGGVGYLTSGEQELHTGVLGSVAQAGMEAIEGIGGTALSVVNGFHDMNRQAILALGGNDIGAMVPTNHIEGPDGKLYNNGAKVPSMMDGFATMWAFATNQNIEQFVGEMGRTEQLEKASRHGFEKIALGASRIAGMGVGMAPAAGAAMGGGAKLFGALIPKGLGSLGALSLAKGAADSGRALKIVQAMSKGIGSSVGNGVFEATTNGSADGYGKAFMHGMAMAPVLLAVGALGKRTEWFAQNRAGMPHGVAKVIGSAMEGVGFGAMEAHFPALLPAAWGFIKDPNEATWQTYAKNIAGFMMFNLASRGRSVNPASAQGAETVTVQTRRSVGRAQFSEKVARGEVTPEQIAKAPTPDEASLRGLGEANIRSREGKTIEERQAAQQEVEQRELELDTAELGVRGRATEEVEQARHNVKEEEGGKTELQQLREQPNSPEKRKRIIELLNSANRNFGKSTSKFTETFFNKQREILEKDQKYAHEELEAGDFHKAILGSEQKGHTEYTAARNKKLREQGIEPPQTAELKAQRAKEEAKQAEQRAKEEAMTPEQREAAEEAAMMERIAEAEKTPEQKLAERRAEQKAGEELHTPAAKEAAAAEQKRHEAGQKSPYVPQTNFKPEATERAPVTEVSRGAEGTTADIRSSDRVGAGGERRGPQSLQSPPTRQVEATPGTKQVRASDIFLEMQGRPGSKGWRVPFTTKRIGGEEGDPVRVAVRGGKIQGPALGHFRYFENLMRTVEGRDLVVGSHEWAHAMHRHMSGGGGREFSKAAGAQRRALPAAVEAEIGVILKDYPGAQNMPKSVQWMEAWAEWHARNLLGEVGLDQKLPATSAYFRSWLAKPDQAPLRKQYERIQSMLFDYNAQGARGRVRASRVLDTDPESASEIAQKPSRFQRARTAITKAMFDDMVELKQSQDKWLEAAGRKPEDVSIMEDPARLFDTLRMTAGKTSEHFVMRGIRLPNGEKVPGLREVMEPIKEQSQDFYDYVVSVRNLELFAKGKKIQLPPQDYAETIKRIKAEHPKIVNAAVALKRWTDALVDYVARSGNLEEASAQRLKDAYSLYVPFFRSMEGPQQGAGGRGVAERGTGLSKITGSTYEIRDPLVALQEVASSMVAKAHQNQVMTALYKMSVGHEAGGMATIVPRSVVPHDHPIKMLLDVIEKKMDKTVEGATGVQLGPLFDMLRDADALDPSSITTFAQKVIPTGERATIAYTPRLTPKEIDDLVSSGANRRTLEAHNGKLQWLEVDTKAYEALMGVDKMPHLPEHLQGVLRILQVPRDMVRLFATGLNPGFVAANAVRDAILKPLFDRDGKFRPFSGFLDMIGGAIEYHKNGRMRELYEELGVKTASFYDEGMKREIVGQNRTFYSKFKGAVSKAQEILSHPENYLRMDSFKKAYEGALKEGKSEQEARMLGLESGKELMNFARAGVVSRMLNQMIPYFNAGLVGKRKFYGQLLYGGDAKGDAAKARVQRGVVLNAIASITMPSVALWLMNKDEDWYQDLPDTRKINYWNFSLFGEILSIPKPFEAGVIFGSLPEMMLDRQLEHAHPASWKSAAEVALGSYMEGIGSFLPAFLRPLIETGANYDFFRRRPLTPEWIERSMPRGEQATFYTTATAKLLSQAVGGALSPIEVEHLLGGYTAGATTSAMRAIDEITGMKDHPLGFQMPWGRFTSQTPHGNSAYVDDLYQLSNRLEQNEDTLQPREKQLATRVDHAKRAISDLRKASRAGSITTEDAERRAYEIAKPLIEESKK